jgi:hypothetical protein
VATAKKWTVEIDISEQEQQTRAEARLAHDDGATITGTGMARLNPADDNVPLIGDELAAARALSELAHNLLHAAAADIEAHTHQPATLDS